MISKNNCLHIDVKFENLTFIHTWQKAYAYLHSNNGQSTGKAISNSEISYLFINCAAYSWGRMNPCYRGKDCRKMKMFGEIKISKRLECNSDKSIITYSLGTLMRVVCLDKMLDVVAASLIFFFFPHSTSGAPIFSGIEESFASCLPHTVMLVNHNSRGGNEIDKR